MKVLIHDMDLLEIVPQRIGTDRRSLGGETGTITVTADNSRGDLTRMLADPPLRARVEVETDHGTIDGTLQAITLGVDALLRIEG
jgi:hypothetical protein